MSALQKLKSVVPGVGESDVSVKTYECQECGNEFESSKTPERTQCIECMSHNVEQV